MPKKLTTVKSRVNSALRRLWLYSDERKQALKKNALPNGFYRCDCCKDIYKKNVLDDGKPKTMIQVDHIVDYAFDDDWNERIKRLFDVENMQVLCIFCHHKKTKGARAKSH